MLDFEKPISELEGKVKELRHLSSGSELDLADEITRLEARAEKLLRQTYAKLNAWQKTQVARHPERPHFSDYVARLLEDYTPLAGDRAFGDDRAIQGGLARFRGRSVVVIGHEKGTDTEGRVRHNFGMANPEGYRKAVRLMHLAERFGLPVLTLVDTPGAYPGHRRRGARPGRGDRARDRDLPCSSACPWSGRSSARAAPAVRSRWRSPTAC